MLKLIWLSMYTNSFLIKDILTYLFRCNRKLTWLTVNNMSDCKPPWPLDCTAICISVFGCVARCFKVSYKSDEYLTVKLISGSFKSSLKSIRRNSTTVRIWNARLFQEIEEKCQGEGMRLFSEERQLHISTSIRVQRSLSWLTRDWNPRALASIS